jgi:uncharacterized protein YndB with AHSA1/START domain
MTATERAADKVVIERTYDARPEDLWALWTTKEGFESWWGPVGFRVEVQALEARVGGRLQYDMIAATPETVAAMKAQGAPVSHATTGWFAEVAPYTRLAITHRIDFIGPVPPYDATMTVDFVPVDGGVRMVVTLDPMHDPEFGRMQSEGFTSQLTKLAARFRQR